MASETLRTPSERDLEIYRLTTSEGLTTRAIAEHMGISQTRVRQINQQVLLWMGDVLPEEASSMPDATRLLVAQQITTSRLDFLYNEAITAWRASQVSETEVRQVRHGATGGAVHTFRREHGNTRYLAAAMSISLKMGKLPAALPLGLARLASQSQRPPIGDCSAEAVEQGEENRETVASHDTIPVPETTCDTCSNEENDRSEPLLGIFGPAQPGISAEHEVAAATAQSA